mgnify:CR=1 FL=1
MIFDLLPVGVGLIDRNGRVILENREMRRFLPTSSVPLRDEDRNWRWRGWHPDGRPLERRDFPSARALNG